MQTNDLLPIIEAAALLRFAKSDRGDLEITPAGAKFAAADIVTRKQLFRHACLTYVALLRQIRAQLLSKSDRSLPVEFFRDLLRESFAEEEVSRQIETALNWGRYAEIFTYNADTDRLTIEENVAEGPVEAEKVTEHVAF